MDVSIDEPRQQGTVAEIDDFGIGRAVDMLSSRDDALALNQHFAWRHNRAGRDVEHAGGVKDDGARRRLCAGHDGREGNCKSS